MSYELDALANENRSQAERVIKRVETVTRENEIKVTFGRLPSSSGNGRSRTRLWEDVAAKLRARPGEWACVGRRNTSMAYARPVSLKGPSFEITLVNVMRASEQNRGKTAEVWIRFVGEAS